MQLTINRIPYDEVLRYLGYHGTPVPDALKKLIEDCISLTLQTITPQAIYRRFAILETPKGIEVKGTSLLLKGKSIREHLQDCDHAYLLAVTIGAAMDKLIRTKMLIASEEGLILDSCATAAVEAAADMAEAMIREECAERGEAITWRFSPGYGDLPIETQADFLTLLDTSRKIGLMVSGDMILTPFKSVTAITGVTRTNVQASTNRTPCDNCLSRESCEYRKTGEKCWN